jgi:hypothetical protein
LDLANRRQRLRTRIDNFFKKAVVYLGNEAVEAIQDSVVNIEELSEDIDVPAVGPIPAAGLPEHPADVPRLSALDPECVKLPFPSSVPVALRDEIPSWKTLSNKEYKLRCGDADDALHRVRECLGQLAWQYKGKVRTASGDNEKTRAWDGIRKLQRKLSLHRRIYNSNRRTLILLSNNLVQTNQRYPEITIADCRVDTVVTDPNARGGGSYRLSWLWSAVNPQGEVVGIAAENDYLMECTFVIFVLPHILIMLSYAITLATCTGTI